MSGRARRWQRLAALLTLAAVVGLARPVRAADELAAPEPPPTATPTADAAPDPTAAAAAAPASQSLTPPLLKGKSLQPGEPGYKSMAWAAAGSFGATLLPLIVGGFLTRAQSDGVMWTGLGFIAVGQSLGPSVGYWYAGEQAGFTWYRLGLSAIALAAAGYPLYAYTGRFQSYSSGGAAALITIAVVAEAATVALAAWDLSLLPEIIEKHNERPVRPLPGRRRAQLAPLVVPLVLPGGGGLGLSGSF